jgi:hypothetical protein
MIIQGFSNIASAYGANTKSTVERQTSPAPAANYADKVSISNAGKALAETDVESPSQEFRRAAIEDAKQDPGFAEKITREFAYDDSLAKGGPLMDISNYPTVRYSYTGELVTESNLATFKAQAADARTGRIALYESEKSKDTPDVEILKKLFQYTDTLSDDYLAKLRWERPKSTEAA